MSEKQCVRCLETKQKTEFHLRKNSKDGLQTLCKVCAISNAKDHYQLYKKEFKTRSKKYYFIIKQVISIIKEKYGCQNCRCKDEICLDFHHVDPKTKLYQVGSIISKKNIELIVTEINKCIVVCSNCHRKIHAEQVNLSQYKKCFETIEQFKQLLTNCGKKNIYIRKRKNYVPKTGAYLCKCGNKKSTKAKHCHKCYKFSLRQTERPSKEELEQLLLTNSYCAVAKMYNVSDNTIRKWEKSYNSEVLMYYI